MGSHIFGIFGLRKFLDLGIWKKKGEFTLGWLTGTRLYEVKRHKKKVTNYYELFHIYFTSKLYLSKNDWDGDGL